MLLSTKLPDVLSPLPESYRSPRAHALSPACPQFVIETVAGITDEFPPIVCLSPASPEPVSQTQCQYWQVCFLGNSGRQPPGTVVLTQCFVSLTHVPATPDFQGFQTDSPTCPYVQVSFTCSTNRLAQADSPFSSGPGACLVAGDVLVLSWKMKVRTSAIQGS